MNNLTPFQNLVPMYDELPPEPANELTRLYEEDGKLSVLSHIGLNAHKKQFPRSKYTLKIQIPNDDEGFSYNLLASDRHIEKQLENDEPLVGCAIYREDNGLLSYNPDHELATQWKEFQEEYEPHC